MTKRRLVGERPYLELGLLDALAFRVRCYSALARMLGAVHDRASGEALVASFRKPTGIDAGGRLIDAAFTHADLAHLIGETRQWVTIRLGRLQKLGALLKCAA